MLHIDKLKRGGDLWWRRGAKEGRSDGSKVSGTRACELGAVVVIFGGDITFTWCTYGLIFHFGWDGFLLDASRWKLSRLVQILSIGLIGWWSIYYEGHFWNSGVFCGGFTVRWRCGGYPLGILRFGVYWGRLDDHWFILLFGWWMLLLICWYVLKEFRLLMLSVGTSWRLLISL